MSSWHSYPSVYALGHTAVAELLLDDVLVEEKVDGSQFSFGRFGGELKVRSKGVVMEPTAPEKMFQRGVDTAGGLDLHDGWTYRGEFLDKPKQNALAYDRVPNGNVIIFDINHEEEGYLGQAEKAEECRRVGLEVVPVLHAGKVSSADDVRGFLERTSVLGGQKIEGVVIKNYGRFGRDKKVLMGKFVSEKYKEVHKASWKEGNPGQGDILLRLVNAYKTEARWEKAVQHLAERGELENSPRDIGKLIPAVRADIIKECKEEITDALYKWAYPHISRGITGGLPEWYKQRLLDNQFTQEEDGE